MRRWTFIACVLCALPIAAHEIGTSRVTAAFERGGTYDIEVVTDAGALLQKLQVSAGSTESTELSRFDDHFRRRVKIQFDDVEARPDIAYSVAQGDGSGVAAATIHLTGRVPAGAKSFRWMYGWTFASYALAIRTAGSENVRTEWLDGGQNSAPFALMSAVPQVRRLETVWRYLTLGFTHILPYGFDHVLFVLGIYLLSGRARSVMWQVSAFTIAHSITLGLSMYGVVSVSPKIVEPMIAISIAYVAIENIVHSRLKSWRIALVFGFGLLHGMGFAGALKELGLPRSEFLTALLTFNLGVEAGQLAVIGTAFLMVGWYCSDRAWYRSRVVIPASLAIACTAVYWTVERLSL